MLCPRCNKTFDSCVVSTGALFENKYISVCGKCVREIELKAANADYVEARTKLRFNRFCSGPRTEEEIASDRAWQIMQKVERFRERLGLPRKPDV